MDTRQTCQKVILPFFKISHRSLSTLKSEKTGQREAVEEIHEKKAPSSFLPKKTEWLIIGLCCICFFLVPLFYISISRCYEPACNKHSEVFFSDIRNKDKTIELCHEHGKVAQSDPNLKETGLNPIERIARNVFSFPVIGVPEFIPVRTVNAEYKLVVFLIFACLVTGLVITNLSLKRKILLPPKPLLIFVSLFIFAIFCSTLLAHNFQRALVYSFLWHIVPLLFTYSLSHVNWTRSKLAICLGSLVLGGVASSLVVMDQHYRTGWSHGLPRTGLGGLIYNQNFAAEYHAPLICLGLGLLLFIRKKGAVIILAIAILLVFLPALTLSLARGAWVGLMAACLGLFVLGLVCFAVDKKRKGNLSAFNRSSLAVWACLAMALALPAYIYTTPYWNKSAFSKSPQKKSDSSIQSKELESIFEEMKNVSDSPNTTNNTSRRLTLWQDALSSTFSSDFFFGKGTDHYELHFHESAELSDKTTGNVLVRFVHNDFIQILYENGIFGLIGFVGIWCWILWRGCISALRRAKEDDLQGLGLRLGLIGSCLVILIEALFEFPTRSPCSLMVGWVSLGILLGLLSREKDGPQPLDLSAKPKLILTIGVIGVLIVPQGCLLAKDLFWSNIYHVQGRIAGDSSRNDESLKFHRKSIFHAPWEHHSRKFECFYLLTHLKNIPQAITAIDETLQVHPGCLVAHQNKIAVMLNNGRLREARQAYEKMEKAAPFHPFTKNELKRFP